jgi:hypothetical protein
VERLENITGFSEPESTRPGTEHGSIRGSEGVWCPKFKEKLLVREICAIMPLIKNNLAIIKRSFCGVKLGMRDS